MKKVEELCSQDFVDSAESSADVRISHSTVTYIDPNLETGSGTISFAVGKHKIKVRSRSTEPRARPKRGISTTARARRAVLRTVWSIPGCVRAAHATPCACTIDSSFASHG